MRVISLFLGSYFCSTSLQSESLLIQHTAHRIIVIVVVPMETARRLLELELELIQTQMTQKPMLRAEVYARALRASQNRK